MSDVIPSGCAIHDMQQQQRTDELVALPLPLIEHILVPGTSIRDKKALRQTCKLFQQVLDDTLTRITLMVHYDCDQQGVQDLLKRMQHMHSLRTLVLTSFLADKLLKHWPDHLSTLTITSSGSLEVQELKRLKCLTALHVDVGKCGKVEGLESTSGLTSLHFPKLADSFAHLAPTLKQLSIQKIQRYANYQHIAQLTNLEALQVVEDLPPDFFVNPDAFLWDFLPPPISDFPNHLLIKSKPQKRQVAPTTLTRLTLQHTETAWLAHLPKSITHLQLLNTSDTVIKQVCILRPWLKHLDLDMPEHWDDAFSHLSRLTNLQALGISDPWHEFLSREDIVSRIPEIAEAVERGVRLHVVENSEEFLDVFTNPFTLSSAWATHA